MPESVKALVSVQRHWTKNMGLGGLFHSATPANEDTAEFYIIPVSKYDISDERFVEIEFYPRVLKDKWARVLVIHALISPGASNGLAVMCNSDDIRTMVSR